MNILNVTNVIVDPVIWCDQSVVLIRIKWNKASLLCRDLYLDSSDCMPWLLM
jgi:hypothetical protein